MLFCCTGYTLHIKYFVAYEIPKMDIFCLSSVTEGTSMTLLEAGASGLPSVVTDVGGNGEIVVDSVTGYVVPSGDEEAFANALLKLVDDEGLREKFGLAARERVCELYSIESMVKAYGVVYEESLATEATESTEGASLGSVRGA